MRIITISTETKRVYTGPLAACIGYFDGMHIGHRALIQKTLECAKETQAESALITFDPDPWVPIRGIDEADIKHISTFRERLNKAVELGIQNVVILKFTKEMCQLSPEKFVSDILKKLNLTSLVCGFDFHYGFMGRGDTESLKESLGVPVYVIPPIEDEFGKISSTRITKAIIEGDMESAHRMLGDWFTIEGTVVHGNRVGSSLGFPTANVQYSKEYILPKGGVYAGFAIVQGKRYKTMINLGHNPTLNYQNDMSLEANILDFKGDLYNRQIKLEFVHFLREEKCFKNRDNLIMQLEQDFRDTKEKLIEYE